MITPIVNLGDYAFELKYPRRYSNWDAPKASTWTVELSLGEVKAIESAIENPILDTDNKPIIHIIDPQTQIVDKALGRRSVRQSLLKNLAKMDFHFMLGMFPTSLIIFVWHLHSVIHLGLTWPVIVGGSPFVKTFIKGEGRNLLAYHLAKDEESKSLKAIGLGMGTSIVAAACIESLRSLGISIP
jgi:hypothetical protein